MHGISPSQHWHDGNRSQSAREQVIVKCFNIQLPLVTQKLDKVESYLLTLEEALGIAGCMQGGGARGGPLTSLLLTRSLLSHLALHSMCVQPLCSPAVQKSLC